MSEPTDIDTDEEEFAENTLIEAIENQIESDNPPAAKATFNKLTLVGYEREEILNLMAHVLAIEIDAILEQDRASTPNGTKPPFAPCRNCLPKSSDPALPEPRLRHSFPPAPRAPTTLPPPCVQIPLHPGIKLLSERWTRRLSAFTLRTLTSNS